MIEYIVTGDGVAICATHTEDRDHHLDTVVSFVDWDSSLGCEYD